MIRHLRRDLVDLAGFVALLDFVSSAHTLLAIVLIVCEKALCENVRERFFNLQFCNLVTNFVTEQKYFVRTVNTHL